MAKRLTALMSGCPANFGEGGLDPTWFKRPFLQLPKARIQARVTKRGSGFFVEPADTGGSSRSDPHRRLAEVIVQWVTIW